MTHANRPRRIDLMPILAAALLVALASTVVLAQAPPPKPPSSPTAPEPATLQVINAKFTGDLDEMRKRRVIRAGVAYNRTHYFIDRGVQRGAAYEALMLFEQGLNQGLTKADQKVNIVFVPMSRDELLPALVDGRIDFAAAQLTVTPERQALVDFTKPALTGVNEIVVAGPE